MVARITERRVLEPNAKLYFIFLLLLVITLSSGFAIANSETWLSSYTAEQPASYQGDPVISGGTIAFIAWESNLGRDLNGDGDTSDNLLAYYDIATGSVTYTKEEPHRLNGESKAISGSIITYIVYEWNVGQDYNGDGDKYDFILAYYDISTDTVTYTSEQPFWSYGNSFDISENIITFIASERSSGRDLNGDGDRYDVVLAYYDIFSGTVTYTKEQPYYIYGNSPTISEGVIAYIANEIKLARDSNGDGDMMDNVLAYYDISTGSATYTAEQPYVAGGNCLDISGSIISYLINEYDVGRDLNADGDMMDNLLAYYNISTGSATYTSEQPYGSNGNRPTLSGGVITFIVNEDNLGQDLNGDGDTMDNMLAYYDIASGSATYTTAQPYWSSKNSPDISGNVITFIAKESDLEQDINGDADMYDNIIAYLTLTLDSDDNDPPGGTEEPPDEDGSTYSVTGLASMIEAFVEDGSIDKRMKNSLLSKTKNAGTSVEKGNINAAVNQLEAMINQVAAQRGKKISDAAADGTTAYVNNLINSHLDELP